MLITSRQVSFIPGPTQVSKYVSAFLLDTPKNSFPTSSPYGLCALFYGALSIPSLLFPLETNFSVSSYLCFRPASLGDGPLGLEVLLYTVPSKVPDSQDVARRVPQLLSVLFPRARAHGISATPAKTDVQKLDSAPRFNKRAQRDWNEARPIFSNNTLTAASASTSASHRKRSHERN